MGQNQKSVAYCFSKPYCSLCLAPYKSPSLNSFDAFDSHELAQRFCCAFLAHFMNPENVGTLSCLYTAAVPRHYDGDCLFFEKRP